MKKTKSQNRIAPITEANKIAKRMATYFERHISTNDLLWWVTTINATQEIAVTEETADLVPHIGWFFLPEILKYKNSVERIKYLQKGAIDLINVAGYDGTKRALANIGSGFLESNARLTGDMEDVSRFMIVLTALLCLTEMYREQQYAIRSMLEAA